MVNLIVAMANVFMNHGHVTDMMIAITQVLMKLTVVVILHAMIWVMISLVMMANVPGLCGHVTDILTVQTAQMKLTVVSLMIHVLMVIVKKAHIGMAILAILVIIV
jgi:hypothetical protein